MFQLKKVVLVLTKFQLEEVIILGRNNKNIKIQINNRIDDLLRIGERKVKNDKTNANSAEGIHSIKTADTYRQTANLFSDYLKTQGIRNIDDITRDHVQGFMLSRADNSAYTHSKDLSAINKFLDTRYTTKEFGLPQRSYSHVSNNRGLAIRDTCDALRNREQLDFVRATGIRRESIATITPSQALRDAQGQVIGFNITEKGGRERNAVVLEQERDYYSGMRDVFINQQYLEKAVSRYSKEKIKGYERDILAEVSQNLGHNRIDVVLYHYLK